MTTRAEEIAAEGPYTRVSVPVTDAMMDISAWFKDWGTDIKPPDKGTKAEAVASLRDLMTAILNRAYKQGQQDRWIPVSQFKAPAPGQTILFGSKNTVRMWTWDANNDEPPSSWATHYRLIELPPNPEQP